MSLSSAGKMKIIQNQCLHEDGTGILTCNSSGKRVFTSRKGDRVQADLDHVVYEIDNVILDIRKSSNDERLRKKLCYEVQSCYFIGSQDGNDFARDYFFAALTSKFRRRCQKFGSTRDQCARKEALNIYNFLCTFYFYILTTSWSKLLLHFESRILLATCYLFQSPSFGKTAEIVENVCTWLIKLGPRLHAHFSRTFSGLLMTLVRDRFLDDKTTEQARQQLIMLIDCHARGWVIRFE